MIRTNFRISFIKPSSNSFHTFNHPNYWSGYYDCCTNCNPLKNVFQYRLNLFPKFINICRYFSIYMRSAIVQPI